MKRAELSGQRFGRLVAVSRDEGVGGNGRWLCACDCGNATRVRVNRLRSGETKSCGCLRREITRRAHATHGGSNGPEYKAWSAMLQRCRSPNQAAFRSYGGRGISVCPEWALFENFIRDMGKRPSASHSIDRIDVNGNYEPANCRWATQLEQARNKRDNRWITAFGATRCLQEWADLGSIHKTTLLGRLASGWEPERAVTEPPGTVVRLRRERRLRGELP